MIKKYFSPFFLAISILLIFYVFYKSEIYWQGLERTIYYKYYLISSALLAFSIITFFINEKVKTYIVIFFFSFIFSLYLFEFYYLYSNDINLFKNYNKVYFKNAIKYEKKHKIYNLSFTPHTNIITSNENGYFATFLSDRYGFNNPDAEWNKKEIEFLLIGDSFTEGVGVNRPNDIASVVRKLSKKNVLNLGISGIGTLKKFAILKEHINKNHNNIIWIYFEGNDLQDLTKEMEDPYLLNYLEDDFKYNVKKNKNYYNQPNSLFHGFLKVYFTRKLILGHFKIKGQVIKKKPVKEKTFYNFKKIMKFAKNLVDQNSSNFYFVYLPGFDRYISSDFEKNYKKIKLIVEDLNIPFIDISKEVFEKEESPLKLFALESKAHYNVEGYRKTAEAIYRLTKQN